MMSVICISAFYFFKESKLKIAAYFMASLSIIFLWLNFLTINPSFLDKTERIVILILFLLVTIHLIQKVFKSKQVDQELIFASIAGYIMIGLMTAILCKFVATIYPNAYSNLPQNSLLVDYAYYSFVTMSTLGYGDITPQIPATRSLSIFITLIGQFYMTVLVAFLIGKFISQGENNK